MAEQVFGVEPEVFLQCVEQHDAFRRVVAVLLHERQFLLPRQLLQRRFLLALVEIHFLFRVAPYFLEVREVAVFNEARALLFGVAPRQVRLHFPELLVQAVHYSPALGFVHYDDAQRIARFCNGFVQVVPQVPANGLARLEDEAAGGNEAEIAFREIQPVRVNKRRRHHRATQRNQD
ncbi:MAG: hypothetical protein AB1626_00995, partial [Candidatus Micrarchaeota archaeon]